MWICCERSVVVDRDGVGLLWYLCEVSRDTSTLLLEDRGCSIIPFA